jgi:lactate dehydrogenase-like 2-hydroxyacid dehydrogenase
MTVDVLMLAPHAGAERMLAAEFTVHKLWQQADPEAFWREAGPRIRAVVTFTTARTRVDAALMDRLPALRHIANIFVGVESIDLDEAHRRGITVTNGAGTNEGDVADMAFGLLLAAARGILAGDRHVRDGRWPQGRVPQGPRFWGRPLGIVGLGHIGQAVARRAAGFEMPVSYWGRAAKPDQPYRFVPDLVQLAREVDFLVVAVAGAPGTHHLVGAPVLEALGPAGILVNVARGFVVDEAALIAALQDGRLGGAALDVFEAEPEVPEALRALPQVLLQPHRAGDTAEAARQALELMMANLRAGLAGRPVLTPVA